MALTDKTMADAIKALKRGEEPDILPINDTRPIRQWKDPTCPKCGIVLGNRMSYACGNSYCPSGLN